MLVAVWLIEVTVTVEDPDERKPVAMMEGAALKAGIKLIVTIDPDAVYV